MEQVVETGLGEVEEAREADDGAVDGAKGTEPKDLGGVVGDGGVVEGAVQDEEGDVGVGGGEAVGDEAQDANGRGDGDEGDEDGQGRGVVEEEPDEGDGEDAAQGKGEVEDVVDVDGEGGGVQEGCVLRSDGGDKVVDARHLDNCVCCGSESVLSFWYQRKKRNRISSFAYL